LQIENNIIKGCLDFTLRRYKNQENENPKTSIQIQFNVSTVYE